MSADWPDRAAFADTDRIAELAVTAEPAQPPSPAQQTDRRVAEFELLEENRFSMRGAAGPFAAELLEESGALRLRVTPAQGAAATLALEPADVIAAVADYQAVCEAYQRAVKDLAPSQIELVDAERRDAHLEGAAAIRDALASAAKLDQETAKRIFSLVSAVRPAAI